MRFVFSKRKHLEKKLEEKKKEERKIQKIIKHMRACCRPKSVQEINNQENFKIEKIRNDNKKCTDRSFVKNNTNLGKSGLQIMARLVQTKNCLNMQTTTSNEDK